MLQKAIGLILGRPEFEVSLETGEAGIVDLEDPPLLHFPLHQGGREALNVTVTLDETVPAGGPLAGDGGRHVLACPVPGIVRNIIDQPDAHGARKGRAIVFEPTPGGTSIAFAPLDPATTAPEALAARLQEAGILSAARAPRPLVELLCPTDESPVDTVIVLAADRDPGVSVALHLLHARAADVGVAASMLGRVAGAKRVVVALLQGEAAAFRAPAGVDVLPLPAAYPETMSAMVVQRAGGGAGTRVVPLESALAALDAVREGKVQARKLLTLIGPDQEPVANYRVALGTSLRAILDHAGIEVGERDKVVAGGPMRGTAVFSLDGAVDAGIDALTVIPAGAFSAWSPEPCINCGRCIDICPVNLQVPLISRYAEFEFFDRTVELDIDQCFECGLCASVCTARRPLLQYIRLAKSGLEVSA